MAHWVWEERGVALALGLGLSSGAMADDTAVKPGAADQKAQAQPATPATSPAR